VFENTTVVEQIYYANAPLGCHPWMPTSPSPQTLTYRQYRKWGFTMSFLYANQRSAGRTISFL
jgi:hypothetical protein